MFTQDRGETLWNQCNFGLLSQGYSQQQSQSQEFHHVSNIVNADQQVMQNENVAANENQREIAEKLLAMERELQRHPSKEAYNIALKRSPEYVQSHSFQLMFLRTSEYDVKAAAKRIVSYFEFVLKYFGEDKLGRRILLSDLSADDMDSLLSGGGQLLPKKTKDGRYVLFLRRMFTRCKHPENLLRAIFYLFLSVSEDEDAQVRGIVMLLYNVGTYKQREFEGPALNMITSMFYIIPIKLSEAHLCIENNIFAKMLGTWIKTVGRWFQISIQPHHLSDLECRYKLLIQFGIPTSFIPMTDNEEVILDNHIRWIEQQQELENNSSLDMSSSTASTNRQQQRTIGNSPTMSATSNVGPLSLEQLLWLNRDSRLASATTATPSPWAASQTPLSAASNQGILGSSIGVGGITPAIANPASALLSLPAVPQQQQEKQQYTPVGSTHDTLLGASSNGLAVQAALAEIKLRQAQQQLHNVAVQPSTAPPSLPGWLAQDNMALRNQAVLAAALIGTNDSRINTLQQSGNIQNTFDNKLPCLTGRPPLVMYTDEDGDILSEYQSLLRKQIELFEATKEDVQFHDSNRVMKNIVLGQVGMRCRYCASLAHWERPKAAVYFPKTLSSLYQFGQNMAKHHLFSCCNRIPHDVRDRLIVLRDQLRRGEGGKDHWARSAFTLQGVYEDRYGLRFCKLPNKKF